MAQRRTTKKQKQFLEIFKTNMALISLSCEKANVGRKTYYNWLEDENFKNEVQRIEEWIKDFGEHALYKLIKEGNPQAIMFYNKTKNKDRDYVERQEISADIKGELFSNVMINIIKPKEIEKRKIVNGSELQTDS